MRKIFLLSCFILFVLVLPINTFAQGKLDKDFAVAAAQYRYFEIEAAQLAAKNAQNPKIKEYAQKVRSDYTKFEGQLKQIAGSKDLKLSVDDMSAGQKNTLTELQKAKGKIFDDMYIKTVGIKLNETQKDLYENQVNKGEDKEYKEYAQTILPTIEEHLSAAQNLSTNSTVENSNQSTTGGITTGDGSRETSSSNSNSGQTGQTGTVTTQGPSLTDYLLNALAFIWMAVPYLLSAAALGLIVYFYIWKILPSFEEIDRRLNDNAGELRKDKTDLVVLKQSHEKLKKDFKNFVNYVNDRFQTGFTYPNDDRVETGETAASASQVDDTPPPPKRIEFPALVKELHDFIHSDSPIVRDDIANNVMVNDAGGNFYVLHDTSTGKDYLVPRSERFQTADDYYTHFAKFYDGDVSFGGSIKIDAPTVVLYTDNGWEVSGKGRLHVE